MNEQKFWTWYKNQLKCLPKNLWKRLAWRPDAYDEEAIAFCGSLVTIGCICYTLSQLDVQRALVIFPVEFFWITVWYHGKYRRGIK